MANTTSSCLVSPPGEGIEMIRGARIEHNPNNSEGDLTIVLNGTPSLTPRTLTLNLKSGLEAGLIVEKASISDQRLFCTPKEPTRNTRTLSFAEEAHQNTVEDVSCVLNLEEDETPPSSPNLAMRSFFREIQDQSHMQMKTPVPSRFRLGKKKRDYTFRSRVPAAPNRVSNLRKNRLAMANTSENPFDIPRTCCVREFCFLNVDKVYAFHWYRELMAMNREERKFTLISWYDTFRGRYKFDGKLVCWEFLNKSFGFSNTLLSSGSRAARTTVAPTSFAQPRQVRGRNICNSIFVFLKLISEACGDKMPHRPFINLPFPTRQQVYEKYIEYYHLHDPLRFTRSPPLISYFYSMWSIHVPEVKTLKNTGFEKCAECVFYTEERARNILNPAALRELKEASSQHYADMARERRGYELRQQLSHMDAQHYLSMVVDGADQSNYGLPHYLQKSKEDRGHKIAVKLVGVLIHSVENDLYLFSMVEGFETGANHIIESIHRALTLRKEKLGKLPPTLFVQADNCTQENKNRFFLGYLEMLVARGVFIEVQMSTLEVGHTHTDVDQSFSCVHKRLDKFHAFSLSQLHNQLEQSYAPAPHVEELTHVINFSGQCQRSKCLTRVSNFTQYRYFRLLRSSNQTEDGFYKTKCTVKRYIADQWKDLAGVGSGFLASIPDLINVPKTATKFLPNVPEVNDCLRAAEARIKNQEIMNDLYALRDRVYVVREHEGHWTESSFEMNGDYRSQAGRMEIQSLSGGMSSLNIQNESRSQRLRYEIGDFVAIKPESSYNTAFWVAEVIGFINIDDEGYPSTLQVRWYVAGAGNHCRHQPRTYVRSL